LINLPVDQGPLEYDLAYPPLKYVPLGVILGGRLLLSPSRVLLVFVINQPPQHIHQPFAMR